MAGFGEAERTEGVGGQNVYLQARGNILVQIQVRWACVPRECADKEPGPIALKAERQRHSDLEKAANGIVRRTSPKQFSVAANEWAMAKEPTWTPKTYQYNRQNIEHLKPDFGGLLTIDICAEDITNYQKCRLKAGAAPKTINHEIDRVKSGPREEPTLGSFAA